MDERRRWEDLEESLSSVDDPRAASRRRRLGQLSARELLDAVVDPDSFCEWGRYRGGRVAGSGVLTGLGTIGGSRVALYVHDPGVDRGSLGRSASTQLATLLERAAEREIAVVGLVDSCGARADEGVHAVIGNARMMHAATKLRGRVPHLVLCTGLCVGAAAYTAALGDFIGMVDGRSFMFISGPRVTAAAIGEVVSIDQLGGPQVHAQVSGACHHVTDSATGGLAWIRQMLSYLGPPIPCADPATRPTPELETLIPERAAQGYDMRRVLHAVFDEGSVLELSPAWAPNLLTGCARLGGRAVAVLASQPMHRAGCVDYTAARKGAAFVRKASTWSLPILTFADTPGFMPGLEQESSGILPFGADLLQAYSDARVPLISLVVRKSYGAGNILSYAATTRLALPTARIGVMGGGAAATSGQTPADDLRAACVAGYIDRVVEPNQVRARLHQALAVECDGG